MFYPVCLLETLIQEYFNKNTILSEARGKAELQRYNESLMFSPDGIAIIDTEDNLIQANQAMLDVLDAQDEI